MAEDRFRKYDELEDDEKVVLDTIRQMKLMSDYNKFKLYKFKVEDLINDYEELKGLREEIQEKYFSIYGELVKEELIEGELDASDCVIAFTGAYEKIVSDVQTKRVDVDRWYST
jgi:hypothetical protein